MTRRIRRRRATEPLHVGDCPRTNSDVDDRTPCCCESVIANGDDTDRNYIEGGGGRRREEWVLIPLAKVPRCDLCNRRAEWQHAEGGLRCDVRAFVTIGEWAKILAAVAIDLDYRNFKSWAGANAPEQASLAHGIWHAADDAKHRPGFGRWNLDGDDARGALEESTTCTGIVLGGTGVIVGEEL